MVYNQSHTTVVENIIHTIIPDLSMVDQTWWYLFSNRCEIAFYVVLFMDNFSII